MRRRITKCFLFLARVLPVILASPTVHAAELELAKLGEGVAATIIYSLVGILMATLGFKVVDWLTPGDLADDISNKENLALAIVAGAMILGICVIIASAVVG